MAALGLATADLDADGALPAPAAVRRRRPGLDLPAARHRRGEGRRLHRRAPHPRTGPSTTLGFFDVYASPWFASIYLLLVVSLLGCIIPRTSCTGGRCGPGRRGRRAGWSGCSTSTCGSSSTAPGRGARAGPRAAEEAALPVELRDGAVSGGERLPARRAATCTSTSPSARSSSGRDQPPLRLARRRLIVSEGDTRSPAACRRTTPSSPAPLTDLSSIPPFLHRAEEARGALRGAGRRRPGRRPARVHGVRSTRRSSRGRSRSRRRRSPPNHPVTLDGVDVFLLGNGYSPVITVRDAKGQVLYSQATPFPAAGQQLHVGRRGQGAGRGAGPARLQRRLHPDARQDLPNGPSSIFPDELDPELVMSVWEGDLFPGGRPQSVYSLRHVRPQAGRDGAGQAAAAAPAARPDRAAARRARLVPFDKVDRWAGCPPGSTPGRGRRWSRRSPRCSACSGRCSYGAGASSCAPSRRPPSRPPAGHRWHSRGSGRPLDSRHYPSPTTYRGDHRWAGQERRPGPAPDAGRSARRALRRTEPCSLRSSPPLRRSTSTPAISTTLGVLQPRALLGDGGVHHRHAALRRAPRGPRPGAGRAQQRRVEAPAAASSSVRARPPPTRRRPAVRGRTPYGALTGTRRHGRRRASRRRGRARAPGWR